MTTIREMETVDILNETIRAKVFFWEVPGMIETTTINKPVQINGPLKDVLDELKHASLSTIEVEFVIAFYLNMG